MLYGREHGSVCGTNGNVFDMGNELVDDLSRWSGLDVKEELK